MIEEDIKKESSKFYVLTLAFLFALFSLSVSMAKENNMLQWNIADMLSSESNIGVLRYGALGFGAYPYMSFLPGAGLRVYIDGVPLKSISPFGPDLETVPYLWADSLEVRGIREVNIITEDTNVNEPKANTSFLTGSGHRFNFDMTFKRKLGENSGIFIGATSSGIHSGGDNLKNSLRNYILKYQCFKENGSTVSFTIRALRDRDGIIDIDDRINMGERKTDNLSASLSINKYPLGKRAVISPVIYYQSGNSRFDRYGVRKSLDDNTAGFNVLLSTENGINSYDLYLSHDTNFFDSRIHKESWTRNQSEINASFNRKNDNYWMMLKGGLMNSSKYGVGTKIEGEINLFNIIKHEVVIRGLITDEYPETGREYYTSLVFSDTSQVSKLKKFNISELEGGLRINKKLFRFGFFGFGSFSKVPLLNVSAMDMDKNEQYPFSANYVMNPKKLLFGYRMNLCFHAEKFLTTDINMNYQSRLKEISDDNHINWPYPSSELFSDIKISGKFINGVLLTTIFGNAGVLRWNDGNMSPNGSYFLFDGGVLIKVSTLELFYKIENITNEDIRWFETMGWVGRNTMWGGKWIFYN